MDSTNILNTKYINLIIIHFIAFSLMFQNNLEIIGFGLAISINVLTNSFLLFDIISSPKNGDAVILILVISIISIFISSVMILIFLVNLQTKYSSQQSPIYLSLDNRSLLDSYKKSYVINIILVFIISAIYFTLLRSDVPGKSSIYLPYYNFNIDPTNIMGHYSFLIFKILLSLASLGLSAYMIYSSYLLCQLNTRNLYIPPNNPSDSIPQFFPHKTNSTINNTSHNLFSNINLNYIIGYN